MKQHLSIVLLVLIIGTARLAVASPIATIGFIPDGGSYQADTLNVDTTNQTSVTVNVAVAMLPQGQTDQQVVSGYDIDILYDPVKLESTGVTFSTMLGDAGSLEVMQASKVTATDGTPGGGVVNVVAGSLLGDSDLQTLQITNNGDHPKILLATLTFNVLDTGLTTLAFDWSDARGTRDIKGIAGPTLGEDGLPLATVVLASNSDAAVPEPGTLLLMLPGVAGLFLARRLRTGRRDGGTGG